MNFKFNLFLVPVLTILSNCGPGLRAKEGTRFSVGGTVTGLSGTLVMQNNGGDDLTLTEDGTFSFPLLLADGASFSVSVFSQPSGQTCTLTGGTGTIPRRNVETIEVTCS